MTAHHETRANEYEAMLLALSAVPPSDLTAKAKAAVLAAGKANLASMRRVSHEWPALHQEALSAYGAVNASGAVPSLPDALAAVAALTPPPPVPAPPAGPNILHVSTMPFVAPAQPAPAPAPAAPKALAVYRADIVADRSNPAHPTYRVLVFRDERFLTECSARMLGLETHAEVSPVAPPAAPPQSSEEAPQ